MAEPNSAASTSGGAIVEQADALPPPQKDVSLPEPIDTSLDAAESLAHRDIKQPRGRLRGFFAARRSNPVTDTSGFPWRAICCLKIAFKSGRSMVGTGFLIGPRTVMTAGHCVYNDDTGEAGRILVVPGLQGATAPFGYTYATRVDYPPAWKQSGRPDDDYGVIFLDDDGLFGSVGKTVEFHALADSNWGASDFGGINVAGYPQRTGGWMERDYSKEVRLEGKLIRHKLNTFEGQSGGPILWSDGARIMCVGVHSYGDTDWNAARRIDGDLSRQMSAWKVSGVPMV